MQYLVSAERNGFPDNHLRELIESFTRIAAEDVRRVAREHLHPRRSSLVVAGPVSAREIERLL